MYEQLETSRRACARRNAEIRRSHDARVLEIRFPLFRIML
jgi:hypothetical protein